MKKIIFFLLCITITTSFYAQTTDSIKTDTIIKPKKNKKWSWIVLPAISYNSDLGFCYGGLLNLYYFGDGTTRPDYKHNIYLEWSHFTKGSDKKIFFFDSRTLIPKIRFTSEIAYLTEQALDFYGFNGYEANFNPDFSDDNNSQYKSRMFYRHERKMMRIMLDFKGKFFIKKLRWITGVSLIDKKIATVDIDKLNKGKDEEDKLPDSLLLYDKYVNWGVITENEKNGGLTLLLKLGLDYDTRNFEPNPTKGMWSSVMIMQGHTFMNNDVNFTQLILTHRQYFTLIKNRLSLAYRVNYQGTIHGHLPFYLLPLMHSTFRPPEDGLGGGQNLRGVFRNRLQGDDIAYANLELRCRVACTKIFKQDFCLYVKPFLDIGMVVDKYNFSFKDDKSKIESHDYINVDKEIPHASYGLGVHYIINQNIVGSADFGLPFDKRDGGIGIYLILNFLF